MTGQGQNAKYSERADNFRFAPMNGHHQARTPCRKSAKNGLMRRIKRWSIDHLVGKNQQLLRDSQPQDMCRLAINDQFEPCQTLVQVCRRYVPSKDSMLTYQFVGSRQVLQCVGQIKTGSSAHTLCQTPDFRRHGKPHGIMPVLLTSPTSKSQSSGASWIGSHLLEKFFKATVRYQTCRSKRQPARRA